MRVVEDDAIVRYIERRLGIVIDRPCRAFGFASDAGEPLAAVVFNDYNGSNIELTFAAERITRAVLRWIANYAFVDAGCRRVTVRAKRRNKPSLRLIMRTGFKFEGVAKRYYSDDDAVIYSMFKEHCKWC